MAVLLFIFVTFASSWLLWVLPDLLAARRSGLLTIGGPVFLLGVFVPGLVALAMTARAEGAAGVTRLLARIGRWEVRWPLYVFAVGYMPLTRLAAAAIARGTTGEWPAFGATPWLLLLAATFLSTWVQAGEEVGWRGYALPRLAAQMGLGPASVLLGIVWALWHLPLFYIAGTGSDGQSFPLYAMHVTAVSVAMAWLYWKSGGSLLLVMLMHAAVNNTSDIVPAAAPSAHDVFGLAGSLVGWISAGLSWLVALACLFTMRSVREMTEGDTVWSDAMKGSRSAS